MPPTAMYIAAVEVTEGRVRQSILVRIVVAASFSHLHGCLLPRSVQETRSREDGGFE